MDQTFDPLDELKEMGAIITGDHFVYTSDLHGDAYVNKDVLFTHPGKTAKFCKAIAERFHASGGEVDIVIAPAIGGAILASWTAYHLSRLRKREILCAYAEKDGDGKDAPFAFRRGYDELVKGRKALVVEDILTTGSSVLRVVTAGRAIGGDVVGTAALVNRGGVTPESVGLKAGEFFSSLCDIAFDTYSEDACPHCRNEIPVNQKIGKGRQFLAKKQG